MEDNQFLIILAGNKTAGKDTLFNILGDYVRSNYQYHLKRYAFADALKEEVLDIVHYLIVNLRLIDYDKQNLKETTYTDKEDWRVLWNAWGDHKRLLDPDYWSKVLFSQYSENVLTDRFNISVITDWRYPNEINSFKDIPQLKIFIESPSNNTSTHSSENSLKPEDCDVVIRNNKISIENFRQEIYLRILPLIEPYLQKL